VGPHVTPGKVYGFASIKFFFENFKKSTKFFVKREHGHNGNGRIVEIYYIIAIE